MENINEREVDMMQVFKEAIIEISKRSGMGLFCTVLGDRVTWQACESRVCRGEGLPNLSRHGIGDTPHAAIGACVGAKWGECK